MDLNSTLFYKAKFDIEAIYPDTDLLWKLVCEIRNWMGKKWKKRGETITDDSYCWTTFKFGREFSSKKEPSISDLFIIMEKTAQPIGHVKL